mmetsp:Transcript_2106/g.6767  ORF Transcript_2106/g.6767 Transcript_2106/m.6767 type:complete len:284 (-) Transcript_2106:35-886(-)
MHEGLVLVEEPEILVNPVLAVLEGVLPGQRDVVVPDAPHRGHAQVVHGVDLVVDHRDRACQDRLREADGPSLVTPRAQSEPALEHQHVVAWIEDRVALRLLRHPLQREVPDAHRRVVLRRRGVLEDVAGSEGVLGKPGHPRPPLLLDALEHRGPFRGHGADEIEVADLGGVGPHRFHTLDPLGGVLHDVAGEGGGGPILPASLRRGQNPQVRRARAQVILVVVPAEEAVVAHLQPVGRLAGRGAGRRLQQRRLRPQEAPRAGGHAEEGERPAARRHPAGSRRG